MARPNLFSHRKFVRLSRLLGSRYAAAGVLELLWNQAYADGNPLIGDTLDVEAVADWDGDPGTLVAALIEANFLVCEKGTGNLFIHDLADHAPEYVLDRFRKEAQRRGENLNRKQVRDKIRKLTPVSQERPRNIPGQDKDRPTTPAPTLAPTLAISESLRASSLISGENEQESEIEFNTFWTMYPRKQEKKRARTAFFNLTKKNRKVAIEALQAHIDLWAQDGRDKKMIPHPTTWIHGERWNDEIDLEEWDGNVSALKDLYDEEGNPVS